MMAWRSDLQALCMLVFLFVSAGTGFAAKAVILNVKRYGAVADGKTDNSQAFMKAWRIACKTGGRAVIHVPKGGKYYVRQVAFAGPCRGQIGMLIDGDIYAPTDKNSHTLEYWIKFGYVSHLIIAGHGSLHGGGRSAWPHKQSMQVVPHSLRLEFVSHSVVHGITSVDSKDKHISIFGCNDITLKKIRTTAPHDSPNTDGLHIAMSNKIRVKDSKFDTGDDCVAIFAGSNDVSITGSVCGPGHGISIGSMGRNPNEAPITKIKISNCTIHHSDNGFRIKTWGAYSYPAIASGITVQDIRMENVRNPIIIDQNYCPRGGCNVAAASQVQIRNVKIQRVWGISTTETAVTFHCSRNKPCRGVELDDIYLVYRNPKGGRIGPADASCSYVNGFSRGIQYPKACL